MTRKRADRVLVERGLFDTRAQARAAIEAGLVSVGGVPVGKPAEPIEPDAAIEAAAPHPWVSRGGVKLAAALDAFGIDPAGLACLDCGASTGGFTQVLLARSAARVYAVDVGRGQLHPKVARDARVVSLEGLDARSLSAAVIPEPVGLLVADVSFISLRLVLPAATALIAPGGALVVLVKPQFEAGRGAVKKGVVRDPAVHAAVCTALTAFVAALGFAPLGLVPSPIAGGDGNREFLLAARREPGPAGDG